MQDDSYVKAVYNGVGGYVSAKDVMMLVGFSARVRADLLGL
jgi:hypothetical protein